MTESSETLRSIAQLLGVLEDGAVLEQLNNDLQAAVAAVNGSDATKATAVLSLKLTIVRESGVIEIKAATDSKLPRPAPGRTMLWSTKDNYLTRVNPRQQALPFTTVAPSRDFA